MGFGFDVHRLVDGGPLRLGGVEIASDRRLEGHSDGDCLLHALCDALLGAVAAGDMGAHFPSSDERWENAESRIFVERVREIVAREGCAIVNLDATIVAQTPALAPHLQAMRRFIAGVLAIDPGAVSIKARTADHLGSLGRSEGIAAQVVALVTRQ